MSQKTLAESADLTPNYIGLLEAQNKKPRPTTLARLCQALGATDAERTELYRSLGLSPPDVPKVIDPEQLGLLVADIYYRRLSAEERFPRSGPDPFERVAERLRNESIHFSPQSLRDHLRLVEERGRVQHVIDHDGHPLRADRDEVLESRLQERYRLREAIVVNCSPMLLACTAGGKSKLECDDELHKCLGKVAAKKFTSLIRATDKIVVGGGRGPFETVHAIERKASEGVEEIASLTGQFDSRAWSDRRGLYIQDADNVAAELFNELGCKKVTLVQTALLNDDGGAARKEPYQHLPRHLREYMESVQDSDDQCAARLPSFALIGVGALTGRHRLCVDGELPMRLRPFAALITNLKDAARNFMRTVPAAPDFYCPVADLTNYLLAVPPPTLTAAQLENNAAWSQLNTSINKFNAQVVSVAPRLFGRMIKCRGLVMVVAGGHWKHYALRAVLTNQNEQLVSHLVTDAESASFLLADS